MVVNMEIGMVTPPVGPQPVRDQRGDRNEPGQVARYLPWLMVLLTFLVMVTCIPQISLFLPDLVMGQ